MIRRILVDERVSLLLIAFVATGWLLACPGAPTPDMGADGGSPCRERGRFQAGKEGGYLPCCEGLTEVFWEDPATDGDGARVCIQPLHREYGCVQGTCGDGECEPGEDGACGCAQDCPDAVWEGAGVGAPCLSDSDCQSGICEGLGCDAEHPGVCAASVRPCTSDVAQFCGCDGTTLDASDACPGIRYRHRGPC